MPFSLPHPPEVRMRTILVLTGVILVAAGCERPIVAPELGGGTQGVEQSLLLSGFNAADTVIVGSAGFRVGVYHDFSSYDSLHITFVGAQAAAGTGTIRIKVGPANSFTAVVGPDARGIVVVVDCAQLPKPHSSALTFYAGEQGGKVFLANLRVFGCWSY
jgi:hypothetical protein